MSVSTHEEHNVDEEVRQFLRKLNVKKLVQVQVVTLRGALLEVLLPHVRVEQLLGGEGGGHAVLPAEGGLQPGGFVAALVFHKVHKFRARLLHHGLPALGPVVG